MGILNELPRSNLRGINGKSKKVCTARGGESDPKPKEDAKVWVFSSRTTGKTHHGSDLNLAIDLG